MSSQKRQKTTEKNHRKREWLERRIIEKKIFFRRWSDAKCLIRRDICKEQISYKLINCWTLNSDIDIHVCNDSDRFQLNRIIDSENQLVVEKIVYDIESYVLPLRPEYEYVTPSHRIVSLRSSKACSIVSANLRSIELIDSAIMLRFSASESRKEQEISAREFYWTIHEESHFVIFISRHENDSDTNRVRHRSCSSRKS
jgi:hypothetical protein